LEYYTGPVFEADLQIEALGGNTDVPRFGSVGSGGRYDDLVARFIGQRVPATGSSIGVSRLIAAFEAIKGASPARNGPVVVLVMDRDKKHAYMQMTQALRNAGIRAEMYLGSSGMKAQLKYADRRNSPLAIIQGTDERQNGEVKIKNLIEGARAADSITDNATWRQNNVAQISVPETKLVETVREMLANIKQDSAQA
jgi:histidyl-tRNA synthetase